MNTVLNFKTHLAISISVIKVVKTIGQIFSLFVFDMNDLGA